MSDDRTYKELADLCERALNDGTCFLKSKDLSEVIEALRFASDEFDEHEFDPKTLRRFSELISGIEPEETPFFALGEKGREL